MEAVLERPKRAGSVANASDEVGNTTEDNDHKMAPAEGWALRAIGLDDARSLKNDAQINVRMSSELKRAGDEALAAAGLTSSEAVRMLYTFAAAHASEPDAMRRALSGELEEDGTAREAQRRECARKLELAHRGRALVPHLLMNLGITNVPRELAEMKDEELEELVYADEEKIGA